MHAKTRRKIHATIAVIWLTAGAACSVVYANSLAWIVFMSWFACVYAAISAWAAETPVEEEK